MSFAGEATGVFGLLGKAWNLLRDRLARHQPASVWEGVPVSDIVCANLPACGSVGMQREAQSAIARAPCIQGLEKSRAW
jgi:hypothetical protein